MTIFKGVNYYLFNTAYPVSTPVYDHLFLCRSFTLISSDELINGNTIVMQGSNLLKITTKAKYVGSTLVTD